MTDPNRPIESQHALPTGFPEWLRDSFVEELEFDLALMDLEIPEMDGLQATRLIREREQSTSTHLPIIAMTAHAMASDEQRCLDAGMDAYIAKPIRQQTVFETIASLIEKE